MTITAGDEELVNTYTTSTQDGSKIAALADGGWIVTWRSLSQDGDDWGIYQQRYGGSGARIGGETPVNTTITGAQLSGNVTGLADGGWLVTWRTDNGDDIHKQWGISQQRFNSSGDAVGGEVTVVALSTVQPYSPAVTKLSDGGWLVSWSADNGDGDNAGILYKRYSSTGSLVEGPDGVNTFVTGAQGSPSITALNDGGWVVTWSSFAQDGSSWTIVQRRYASDGVGDTTDHIVNSITTGGQDDPSVAALGDGGWVVAWTGARDDSDGDKSSVHMRRYSSDGTPGAEVQVNTLATGYQQNPEVAGLSNGGWVVTWIDEVNDGSGTGVYFQVYDSTGAMVGGQTLASETTNDHQTHPAVSALLNGRFVISWESRDLGVSDFDIFQRVFDSDGTDPDPDPDGNHAPVANDDVSKVGEYGKTTIKVLANDTDEDGDPLSVLNAKVLAGDGSVKINTNQTLTYDAASHVWDLEKGEKEIVKIRYVISDGEDSSTAIVRITVNGVSADIRGNGRNNDLHGTKGADVIEGLAGKDRIDGGRGNDILVGGKDADTFVFKTGYDKDTISDFLATSKQHDILDLKGLASITSFTDLMAHHASQIGGDVLIDGLHGDTILLKNVTLAQLDRGDFHF